MSNSLLKRPAHSYASCLRLSSYLEMDFEKPFVNKASSEFNQPNKYTKPHCDMISAGKGFSSISLARIRTWNPHLLGTFRTWVLFNLQSSMKIYEPSQITSVCFYLWKLFYDGSWSIHKSRRAANNSPWVLFATHWKFRLTFISKGKLTSFGELLLLS